MLESRQSLRHHPLPVAAFVALAGLSLAAGGCGEEPQAVGPRLVEDAALGIALTDLPTDCQQVEAAMLTLQCSLEGVPGTVTFEEGEEGERNMLALANQQKEWFLARPGGEYNGNRELVTPSGAAYTARGTYDEGGQRVEETRVLALHPSKDRPIVFRYRYPPSGRQATQARIDHLLFLVGELGAAGGGAEAGDAASASPDAEPTPAAAPTD